MDKNEKTYIVHKVIDKQLEINGRGDNHLWKSANLLTDFVYPWDNKTPPKTEFKALWSEQNLYFLFKMVDKEIILIRKNNGVEEINTSDRVELFFKKDDGLNPYYCLEMDSAARVLDFRAYPNKKFQFDWNWPTNGLQLKTSLTKDGYIVEGTISLESLRNLNLIDGAYIKAGIYRANYHQTDEGLQDNWISWVVPNSATPNFHIPSSFGLLYLKEV